MLSSHIVCAMKQLYRETVIAALTEGKYCARGGMVSPSSDAQLDEGALGIIGSSSQYWKRVSDASLHLRRSVCSALTCWESNRVIEPCNGATTHWVTSRWVANILWSSSSSGLSMWPPQLVAFDKSPLIWPRNEILGSGNKTCATSSSCAMQLLKGSTAVESLLRSSASAVVK